MALSQNPAFASNLEEARRLLAERQYDRCLPIIKKSWLENPDNVEPVKLLAQLAGMLNRRELAAELNKLAANLENLKSSPQRLFEAGYRLIDDGEHELAVMLLKRAADLAPEEPIINYELGFALMSLGRHAEAVPYFERSLNEENDFDTRLNLAVSYVLSREVEKARAMVSRLSDLARDQEETHEAAHQFLVLRRLEELNDKPVFNARDWLFIQYGAMLLCQSSSAAIGSSCGAQFDNYETIACTLLALRGVLDGLGERFEIVEHYNPDSKPIAQAISHLLSLPLEPYGGSDRQERALLVLSSSEDITGQYTNFVEHKHNRSIFALRLDWQNPLPVTPDIIGMLTESPVVPWQGITSTDATAEVISFKPGEAIANQPKIEEITEKILEKAQNMEADPEVLHAIEETIAYYSLKRDWLVLANCETFPRRPEYKAELPL